MTEQVGSRYSFYNPANQVASSQQAWQQTQQQQPQEQNQLHARQVSERLMPSSGPSPDTNSSHATGPLQQQVNTSTGFLYRDGAAGTEFSPVATAAGFKPYRSAALNSAAEASQRHNNAASSQTAVQQQNHKQQQQQHHQQQLPQQQHHQQQQLPQQQQTIASLAKQYDDYFESCILANPLQADFYRQQKQEYRQYLAQFDPYLLSQYQAEAAAESETPGRCTPLKHSLPHTRLSLSCPGLAVQVPPARPDEGEPARVHLFDSACLTAEWDRADFAAYPGPLSPGETLKSEVRAYLNAKLLEMHERLADTDWEDAALLIGFLDFLVRNNGIAAGSDLSDLLLEGHEPRTSNYRNGLSAGLDASAADVAMDAFASLPPSEPASGRTSPTALQQQNPELAAAAAAALSQAVRQRDEVEAEAEKRLDRFRKLLMYGRKREALEYASRRGLWGQALFLAHQMDAGLHSRMLERFLARAMQPGDPLVSLYQFMQGRQPELTDLSQWRPFLAMLLANRSDRPRLAATAAARLGDRLTAAGRLYAGQLCYLLAGGCAAIDDTDGVGDAGDAETLDPFRPDGPIRLIGFDSAAADAADGASVPSEAIQLTEVFEFAIGLRDRRRRFDGVCQRRLSSRLLPYKFLYAVRLLDSGLSEEAFRYCREVGQGLLRLGSNSQPLLRETVQMAERLRCHPAVSEHLDSDWLAELSSLAAGLPAPGHTPTQPKYQQLGNQPSAARQLQPTTAPSMAIPPPQQAPQLQQQQQQQQQLQQTYYSSPQRSAALQSAPPAAAAHAASSVHVAFDAFDEPVAQIPDYQRRRTLSSSTSSAHGDAAAAVGGNTGGHHSRQTSPVPASLSPPSSPSMTSRMQPPPQPPQLHQYTHMSQPPPPPPQPSMPLKQAARSRDSSLSSTLSHQQRYQQQQQQLQPYSQYERQPSSRFEPPSDHAEQGQAYYRPYESATLEQPYLQQQQTDPEQTQDPEDEDHRLHQYDHVEQYPQQYQYQQLPQRQEVHEQQPPSQNEHLQYQQPRRANQPQKYADNYQQQQQNQQVQQLPQSQQQYQQLPKPNQLPPQPQQSNQQQQPPKQQEPSQPPQPLPYQQPPQPQQPYEQQQQQQNQQTPKKQEPYLELPQQQQPYQQPQQQPQPYQQPQQQQQPYQQPQQQQQPYQQPQQQQQPYQQPQQQQQPYQQPQQQQQPYQTTPHEQQPYQQPQQQQQQPYQQPQQQQQPYQQPQQQQQPYQTTPHEQQPYQQPPQQPYQQPQQQEQPYQTTPLERLPPQQPYQQSYPQPQQQSQPTHQNQQPPPSQQQYRQPPLPQQTQEMPQPYPQYQQPQQYMQQQQEIPAVQPQPEQPLPQQQQQAGMFSRMFGRMFGGGGGGGADTQTAAPPSQPPQPQQQQPPPLQQQPPPARPPFMQPPNQSSTTAPGGPPPPPPQPLHFYAPGKSIYQPLPQ